jgi:RNase adapter protein RapZ
MRIHLITGISGSGKSVALRAFEDSGYDCIDNLPVPLIEQLVETMELEQRKQIAIAVDARRGESILQLPALLEKLRAKHEVEVLFLNADTNTLVQRFSETRRRHPLSNPNESTTLIDVIEKERQMLAPLAEQAQQIDTGHIPAHTLRQWITEHLKEKPIGLALIFESFAFKKGVPSEADIVFDVRCLPNPHYEPPLRELSGKDKPVAEYLTQFPEVAQMLADIKSYLEKWLPRYLQDGRSYLTVAIGCTGGQHRSVYIVHQLKNYFSEKKEINNIYFLERHRELDSKNSRIG